MGLTILHLQACEQMKSVTRSHSPALTKETR